MALLLLQLAACCGAIRAGQDALSQSFVEEEVDQWMLTQDTSNGGPGDVFRTTGRPCDIKEMPDRAGVATELRAVIAELDVEAYQHAFTYLSSLDQLFLGQPLDRARVETRMASLLGPHTAFVWKVCRSGTIQQWQISVGTWTNKFLTLPIGDSLVDPSQLLREASRLIENWATLVQGSSSIPKPFDKPVRLWVRPEPHYTPIFKLDVVGHRGAGATNQPGLFPASFDERKDLPANFVPENTIISFREAIFQGADGLEFDVYPTLDDQLACIHDDEVDMNIAGKTSEEKRSAQDSGGLISKMNMSEVKQLDVGHGQTVPELFEVLDLASQEDTIRAYFGKRPLIVNVELKGQRTGQLAAERIQQWWETHQAFPLDSLMFSSFKWHELLGISQSWLRERGARILPAVKTKRLFGKDHVTKTFDIEPPDAPITPEAFQMVEQWHMPPDGSEGKLGLQGHDGVDFILSDMRPPFVNKLQTELGGDAIFMVFVPNKRLVHDELARGMLGDVDLTGQEEVQICRMMMTEVLGYACSGASMQIKLDEVDMATQLIYDVIRAAGDCFESPGAMLPKPAHTLEKNSTALRDVAPQYLTARSATAKRARAAPRNVAPRAARILRRMSEQGLGQDALYAEQL